MIVKVPKEIKSYSHPYRIVFKENLWLVDEHQGDIDHINQVIRLEPKNPPSQRAISLIHEVLESVNRHDRCRMDDDTIERLAHGIGEFLFDNLGLEFDWQEIPTE